MMVINHLWLIIPHQDWVQWIEENGRLIMTKRKKSKHDIERQERKKGFY